MATCSFIILYDDCRTSLKYAVNMSTMDPAATSSYLGSFIRSEDFLCSAFLSCNQCVHMGIILQRCCRGTRWSPKPWPKCANDFGWWQMDANGPTSRENTIGFPVFLFFRSYVKLQPGQRSGVIVSSCLFAHAFQYFWLPSFVLQPLFFPIRHMKQPN